MDKLYKVTNEAKTSDGVAIPVYLDWNTALLSDNDLERWNTYRNNINLSDMSPEQRIHFKNTPEAIKLAVWATNNNIGEVMPGDPLKPRMNGFKLNPGITYGLNERQVSALRYLEKKEIREKLKPGQVTPLTHYEGYLVIEQMTPNDFEKPEDAGFKCETCGKVCSSKAALLGHQKSHK